MKNKVNKYVIVINFKTGEKRFLDKTLLLSTTNMFIPSFLFKSKKEAEKYFRRFLKIERIYGHKIPWKYTKVKVCQREKFYKELEKYRIFRIPRDEEIYVIPDI